MAKKIIIGCLTLFNVFFINSMDLPRSGRVRSKSVITHSKKTSPQADVYVRISGNDSGLRHAVAINQDQLSSRSGWFNKKNFDRLIYVSALVGVGVAIGTTISTCGSMQKDCSSAQTELSQCLPLLDEIRRLGVLVCKLDPSLCDKA